MRCLDTGLDTPTGGRLARGGRARSGRAASAPPTPTASPTSTSPPCCAEHERNGPRATMTVVRPELQFGVAELNGDGRRARLRREAAQRALDQRRLLLLRALGARAARRGLGARARAARAAGRRRRAARLSPRTGSGTAWTPTRTRCCSTICGRRARRRGSCGAEPAATRCWSPAPTGCSAAGSSARCWTGGAPVTVLRRDEPARSALALMELEQQVNVVPGDICTEGLVAPGAGRVRDRQRLSSRRADASCPPPTARRSRRSRPTSAAPGSCSRPAGQHGAERVIVASSDKAYGPHAELPYREDSRAAADLPLRRLQGGHRPAGPLLLAHLAAAGGGDPVRQPVRRRATSTARGWSRRRCRRRWPAARPWSAPTARPSATSSTSRTRWRPTWRSGTRWAPGHGRGEAFNAGGGQPAPRARRRRADLPARRHRRDARRPRRRHAGRRDRPPVGRLQQAARAHRVGSRRSTWRRACGGRSSGTGSYATFS